MKTYLCSNCNKKVRRSDLVEHRTSCGGDLTEHTGAAGTFKKGLSLILWIALAVIMAGLSIYLGLSSFKSLARMRELERVPATTVRAVLPGEVNLNGTAVPGPKTLTAPKTNSRCMYYRYHVERREKDSDGDSRWVTVTDTTKFVPFILEDDTGSLRVIPSGNVDFGVPESWSDRRGDMRYTEYRIDPGDSLFIFGYVQRQSDGFQVVFTPDGHYHPIISERGETRERIGMAGGSIVKAWLGLVALAMTLSVMISIFRQHRLLIYFTILNLAVFVYLMVLGLNMMKMDLQAAAERLETYQSTVKAEIQSTLGAYAISWQGDWAGLPEFDRYGVQGLPDDTQMRLSEIRLNLARSKERVSRQRAAFPERFLAPLWRIPDPEPLPLPENQRDRLDTGRGELETARVPPMIGLGVIAVSLLTAIMAFIFGFRKVKFKRCMENIPTSPTTGAAYGVTELKGVVDLPESADFLTGPLSNQPCVQYHYVVKEKRGSGKKSKWVTITNETRGLPFICQDGYGSMLIDPAGAEIHTTRKSSKRRGRRRYTETRLEVGDPLYAIGACTLDPVKGDRLYLQKPEEKELPFILSNMSEPRVMLRIARLGILMLNISFAGILLMALLLFGLSGSFAATDYLAAALTAPLFMTCVTLALHYNDLVFLRERANRNWSNIDVSLQKRSDLVPQLENVTRGLMEHERSVQESLSEMRTLQNGKVERSPDGIRQHMEAEHASVQKLILLRENYPELKSNTQISLLMRTLILLENELALMRNGYNDAVEIYNTRIQTFPDLFFARLFHFKEKELLFAGTEATRIPPSIQSLWEKEQIPPREEKTDSAATDAEETASAAPSEMSPATPAALAAASPSADDEPEEDPAEQKVTSEFLSRLTETSGDDLDTFRELERLYPKLRELSPSAYRHFITKVIHTMEEDEVITVLEFAVQSSISCHLDPDFGLTHDRPIRHRGFDTMLESVSDLLSMLARMEETPETRQQAFDLGVKNLNHPDTSEFSLRDMDPGNLAAFDHVLDDIAHAAPMYRSNVVYACEALIRMNEDATPDQILMMCAIADTLGRPRPSWTSQ